MGNHNASVMDYQVFQELNRFSNIVYRDSDHTYTIGDKKAISGTSFIKLFEKPFDTKQMAEKYAKKHNMDVADVIQLWDDKRDASTIKGTHVHSYAEHRYMNKVYEPDFSDALSRFFEYSEEKVTTPYGECVKQFDQFYNDSKSSLIPVKSELVVGDEDLLICGMSDQLFYNLKMKELQIWDWKTNKEISSFSPFKNRMLNPIEHLHQCELVKYSLQLHLYKYIIEKNTNLKIGSCYIAHFSENIEKYNIIKTRDLSKDILRMIDHYKLGKKAA